MTTMHTYPRNHYYDDRPRTHPVRPLHDWLQKQESYELYLDHLYFRRRRRRIGVMLLAVLLIAGVLGLLSYFSQFQDVRNQIAGWATMGAVTDVPPLPYLPDRPPVEGRH